jgi:phosphoribosylpyrophosphate synthetase
VQKLRVVLRIDLPQFFQLLGLDTITVCVVPRAKSEQSYHANQHLFRSTVRATIGQINGFVDGTSYMRRHTNTKTTHLRNPVRGYVNDGQEPYVGITEETCEISPNVRGRNILLVDDVYTSGVNIDEDAINALLRAGARTVTFYAVGKV